MNQLADRVEGCEGELATGQTPFFSIRAGIGLDSRLEK